MKKFVVATAMAVAMGGASAQMYVEAAYGVTNLDVDCTGATTCDKSGTGGKVIGGYSFNRNLSVEVGYVSFGEAKFSGQTDQLGFLSSSVKSTAYFIGGAFRGEFASNFSGVLRLAAANVESKTDAASSFYGSGSGSDTKVEALVGLGIEYAFTKNLKVTGGVDFTQSPIAEDNKTATLRLISAGVKYEF